MELLDYIIGEDKRDFKCYDILRELYNTNDSFQKTIQHGVIEGTIQGFSEELWEKLDEQVIRARGVDSFGDVFRDGANLGYCTVAAKQVSYSLPTCYLCGGTVDYLVGTVNSPDGSHTWIEFGDKIIDTTFVLVFDKKLATELGYHEENRYNPNTDPIYLAAKELVHDSTLRKK